MHQGKRDSFAVNSETGLAQCHSECRRGWDIVALEQELSGLEFVRAKEQAFKPVARPDVPYAERDLEAAYDYVDEQGLLRYQVVRRFGKRFSQRRPDGRGGWIWGLGEVAPLPFNLPAILKTETVIAICEGEKDCVNLTRLGMLLPAILVAPETSSRKWRSGSPENRLRFSATTTKPAVNMPCRWRISYTQLLTMFALLRYLICP